MLLHKHSSALLLVFNDLLGAKEKWIIIILFYSLIRISPTSFVHTTTNLLINNKNWKSVEKKWKKEKQRRS